jgi:hypothetical protein
MSGHINNAVSDDLVQWVAAEALTQYGMLAWGLAGEDKQRRIAESCWWWAKNNIKFVHHESLLRRYLGESGHLQGLIAPDILLAQMADGQRMEGDCAIFTAMLCAMLKVAGVPWEIVTVAVNPREPEIFSHVYPRAVMGDGRRLPLDASHGTYPGWQVPSSDVSRVQVWDESGNPVSDRGSRFDGLHNYGLRGLGDVCNYGDPDYDPAACEASGAALPTSSTTLTYPVTMPAGAPTYVAPSQSSAQWAAFATALAKGGLTLAEINAIQPGTVVGPNGQILRQNPGYAVGTPTGALNIGAGLSSNTLLYGGIALALGLMFMGKK